MSAVRAALDHLLYKAPTLAGMKFVHWYDCEIKSGDDPINSLNFMSEIPDEDDEIEVESAADNKQTAIDERVNADKLIESVETGDEVTRLNAVYHIILLTGVGGRVMVRRYEHGSYKILQQNIEKWNQDLALTNSVGSGMCKPLKLIGRMLRLLKYQKKDKNIFKRADNELSGIAPAIIAAILSGGKLPDAVAVRALAYIRSKLLSSENTDGNNKNTSDNYPDGWACQWLKVWLIRRKEGEDKMLGETYNDKHGEPAYHCGALMATYASIQNYAMKDVNTNVVQRYYASCIQTPALVLGRLSQLSVHHLEKIEYKSVADYYNQLLETISGAIGEHIPVTLDLEKQSYFALGYYQMSAKIRIETRERIEAAKIRKTQNNNDKTQEDNKDGN